MKIIIYTLPHCVQCRATYRKLDSLGLKYLLVELSSPEHQEKMEKFKSEGFTQAPIVEVFTSAGSQVWSGFDPQQLERLVD